MDSAKIMSNFLEKLEYEQLPEATVENVRLFLIDYISAAMAGYKINTKFNHAVEKYVFAQGGAAECRTLFHETKIPVAKAAFLDACYAHGADMDDGNRKAMGHVGAHVFSTVLSQAQSMKCTEHEVITAVIAGYEVYCRVAAAAQPGLVHRGFHSTGTAGVIACAAASAKLLKLDAQGIYNAMAISVTMASGLMIIAESGQSIKPLNPAKAAECGILAAFLAKEGVEGGRLPLDSEKGWFHAMTDVVCSEMITDGLGDVYCIDECYIKPYPSCRHTHCGIQAVLEMKREYGISAENIKRVKVYIYSNAIKIAGQIKCPQNADDTKFSIHYSIACVLSLGRFSLSELNCKNISGEVTDVIDRIELIEDETMENRDKGIRGCRVCIITNDGNQFEKTVFIPKGDPQNPFSFEDMRNKFDECAEGIIDKEQGTNIFSQLRNFGSTNKSFMGVTIA